MIDEDDDDSIEPTSEAVLPPLRAWLVEWEDGFQAQEEIILAHLCSCPFENTIAFAEYMLAKKDGILVARQMVNRVIVSPIINVTEIPIVEGPKGIM
jgi:hypothetical protein